MFTHKKIEFRDVDLITQQLLEIAREFNPDLNRSQKFDLNLLKTRVPSLYQQFLEKNIEVEIFREFVSPPFSGLAIHVDGTAEHVKNIALNWPIEHCQGTRMFWWQYEQEPKVLFKTVDQAYKTSELILYSAEGGTIVNCCEIVSPTLVNVKMYHSVENSSNYRRMISFRFRPEPWHLLD